MAKPDDRSDNVDKLQESVQNTIQNLHEAEEYLTEHAEEISETERSVIEGKNKRRAKSIAGQREEIQDEASDH